MSWLWALLLAIVALALILLLLRWFGQPRSGWEAIAAALLLGIAGYGLQGRPGMPGSPKAPAETIAGNSPELVEARKSLAGAGASGETNNKWSIIADALARHGQFADAAGVLLGAVDKNPRDGDAWLALANALVGHAEGSLSPAALFAFRNAATVAPEHPGPPFFLGLAMAQSGRFDDARAIWTELLARTPPDAPWRPDLVDKLQRLDMIVARQNAMQGMPMGQPGTMP
ncbi:tetratricopeptide repeat protein [Novosphingobium sp. JCM 18896]|uniref:tetratricopeptide repeat protein n=1 Tax=Novosphingobium sp. JCM 18896 TaxID=2989731 RepID=UPI002222D2B3|nr:tetratricopeptide repeat protein [Novosphingobium sp. JCM 18896]MCW1428099.1 tetratricopeptide repeat protein [Novosphingobium sp. JCM 18896]